MFIHGDKAKNINNFINNFYFLRFLHIEISPYATLLNLLIFSFGGKEGQVLTSSYTEHLLSVFIGDYALGGETHLILLVIDNFR